ncbi:MAG: hypothetical protein OXG35_17540, partial [Acidobacteria bacterium]|nr:hypothetical protein [Acidobacteriota bacterium]
MATWVLSSLAPTVATIIIARLGAPVEAGLDQLAVAVEELAVHVDGLVERVAPRLVRRKHTSASGGELWNEDD